jgi:hypothetical protein
MGSDQKCQYHDIVWGNVGGIEPSGTHYMHDTRVTRSLQVTQTKLLVGNGYSQQVIRGNTDHTSSDPGDPRVDSWTALEGSGGQGGDTLVPGGSSASVASPRVS